MNIRALLARADERTVRAGLVGVGQFGMSLVSQCRHVSGLDIVAVCDRDRQRCVDALALAGTGEGGYRHCDSLPAAKAALECGQVAVLEDASLLAQLPVDILVEATGVATAAVEIAALAIDNGLHVAMVTKEAESVVGPELAARARSAQRVCTPVDGDQPGLLLGLLSWARVLGLPVVCAGKSSEYDFVFDPAHGEARWHDRSPRPALGLIELWDLHAHSVEDTLAMRAQLLAGFPQRTVPDLCEMLVVANATDLEPDVPCFHVPVVRTVEVPSVFRPRADGGILEREGVVDVFNCLRRRDEASFAGGVFVVVRCVDREVWKVLRDKGHLVTEDAGHAMLYNPQHLLGIEAPLSLLQAVLLDQGAAEEPRQRFDLVARTTRAWRAGEALRIDDHHHHEVHGLEPMLLPARAVTGSNPVPYYMAVDQTLARDLAVGEVIGRDVIQAPRDSALWRVRGDLEARFDL